MQVPLGSVLAGKYRVDRVLGQGGMGIVVAATHLQLGTPVAMKFLLPEVLDNQQVVQRFLREAQAAVRLKSEHVARVIDVGTLDTGAPYMVLEYLDGTDLAHFPRNQMTVGLIVDLMLQACEALAEAHALGIVHRDIKPANFFVTRRSDGSFLLKVLDFGISKSPVGTDQGLTQTQSVMGTPAYMSPEQMRSSKNVDNRSDVWALGVVLYELLQGAPPFEADTFSGFVIKVATEALPPMLVRLPTGLAEVVYRCLEKDVTKRWQNVAELAVALGPYAQSNVQAAISVERTARVLNTPVPRMATHPGSAPSTLTAASGAFAAPATGKKKWPLVAAGLAVVAGVVITAVAMSGGGGDGSGSSAPAAATSPGSAPVATRPPATPPTPPATTTPPPPPATPPPPTPPATTPPPTTTPPPETTTTPATTTPPPDVVKPVVKKPKPKMKPVQPSGDDDLLGHRN